MVTLLLFFGFVTYVLIVGVGVVIAVLKLIGVRLRDDWVLLVGVIFLLAFFSGALMHILPAEVDTSDWNRMDESYYRREIEFGCSQRCGDVNMTSSVLCEDGVQKCYCFCDGEVMFFTGRDVSGRWLNRSGFDFGGGG